MASTSLISYIYSRDFLVDYMVVRTGDDSVEWSSIRGRSKEPLEWLNGYLLHVSSAKRMRGTIDEFASFVEKKLRKHYRKDPEFEHCAGLVHSFIEDIFITR
jgi:hypothetical protein